MCVTYSVLYGMVSYCVVTTLMLSLAGVKVVRGRFFRRANSSERQASDSEQQASGHTPVITPVPAILAQEAPPPPTSLIDVGPEQLALQFQEHDLPVIRNPGPELPFQIIMSNILRSQNNPFN
jgi:hypothetical protein